MNSQKFETETAIRKAAAAVREETRRSCENILVFRLDGLQRQVIGYEYRVKPKDRFVEGSTIELPEAESLLHRSFLGHEATLRNMYGSFWDALDAPIKAALLEFSHYYEPLLLDRIMGLRNQVRAGFGQGIADMMTLSGDVLRSYRWNTMERRIKRLAKQLRSGQFVAVERPAREERPALDTGERPSTKLAKRVSGVFKQKKTDKSK